MARGHKTRDGIVFHTGRIKYLLGQCQYHLQKIDELAADRSALITEYLPALVFGFEEITKQVANFDDQL